VRANHNLQAASVAPCLSHQLQFSSKLANVCVVDVLLVAKNASGLKHRVAHENLALRRKHICIFRSLHNLTTLSRISQVEQKIDGLVASLVSPPAKRPDIESTPELSSAAEPQSASARTLHGTWKEQRKVAPGSWLPFPSSFEQSASRPEKGIEQAEGDAEADHEYIEKIRTVHRQNFGDEEDLGHAPESLFQPSKRREAPVENDLVQQLLESHEAELLLVDYRQMSASFPFVIVPPSMTASQLYDEKPMLFLAVILTASWRDHQRQMLLDVAFRRELAERTIISPRRTLGLVQSVLVYLSW
jgi:Ni,Fe-hydrogenase maturation factor